MKYVSTCSQEACIRVTLSGRGDKDIEAVADELHIK